MTMWEWGNTKVLMCSWPHPAHYTFICSGKTQSSYNGAYATDDPVPCSQYVVLTILVVRHTPAVRPSAQMKEAQSEIWYILIGEQG